MELTFSWLYGAAQPQECPACALPVYPVGNALHKFWCDGEPIAREVAWPGVRDYAIPQRYRLGTAE